MPILLDGKKLAEEINIELMVRVARLKKLYKITPILVAILVGDDPASVTYVKMKQNACERVGLKSILVKLPKTATTGQVIKEIKKLNKNKKVFGILLQHPVPKQVDETKCFNAIDETKDVDGVTYASFAKTAMNEMIFGCATPLGIIRLLEYYKIPIQGQEAVVIGRSQILGKPMAMMLLNKNATVTICHSKTENIKEIVKRADIIVAALGQPKFVKADWVKLGAVVIDAGYNQGNIGDTDLEKIILKVSAYTPVPGGVGPMTIITLIEQTVHAAEIRYENN
jgi:methylenetetrahydrofolate dehydrogenase (NADP+) / methenyltetrahydrofolate cyclohydrolase